jgi:hypothetical protein
MFIKHGDGKIISIIKEEELNSEAKKTAEELSKKEIDSKKVKQVENKLEN